MAPLAALFESGHLGELQAWGTTPLVQSATAMLTDQLATTNPTIGDILDAAYDQLIRHSPVEYVFKSCVLKRQLYGRHSPSTTAFYTEFKTSDSRADVLVVNGSAHVYEIKTRYDDFSRLCSQLSDYHRVFTRVTVFTDAVHAEQALALAPPHVGVAVLSPRFSMSAVREASEWTEGLCLDAIFRVLREDEYMSVLTAHGVDLSGVDPRVRYHRCREAFVSLPPEVAHAEMVRALKRRQATPQLAELSCELPVSLRLAPFAYRMAKREWRTLISVAKAVVSF